MEDTFIKKDNLVRTDSKRGKEESVIEETDPKKTKEENGIDEIDSTVTKSRKTGSIFDNITRHQTFDEEGTYTSIFSTLHV